MKLINGYTNLVKEANSHPSEVLWKREPDVLDLVESSDRLDNMNHSVLTVVRKYSALVAVLAVVDVRRTDTETYLPRSSLVVGMTAQLTSAAVENPNSAADSWCVKADGWSDGRMKDVERTARALYMILLTPMEQRSERLARVRESLALFQCLWLASEKNNECSGCCVGDPDFLDESGLRSWMGRWIVIDEDRAGGCSRVSDVENDGNYPTERQQSQGFGPGIATEAPASRYRSSMALSDPRWFSRARTNPQRLAADEYPLVPSPFLAMYFQVPSVSLRDLSGLCALYCVKTVRCPSQYSIGRPSKALEARGSWGVYLLI